MAKYVYLFSEGNASMKELLGGKGANLAEMTGLGPPVPEEGSRLPQKRKPVFTRMERLLQRKSRMKYLQPFQKMESIVEKGCLEIPKTLCWFQYAQAQEYQCPV